MRWWVGLVVMFVAVTARASSPLTLAWDAPDECPSRDEVAADVENRLGGSTQATPLAAHAKVTKRGDAMWQVVLTTDQNGTTGERTLEGSTCTAVASATALILTLTIDPQALTRPATPRALPPKPIEAPPPRRVPARREPSRALFVRLAPMIGFGVAANAVSAGATAAFGARIDRFSVELVASAFAPESRDVVGVAGVGGTFWSLAVGGSACVSPTRSRSIRLAGCAGLEVESIHGEGYGVRHPMSGLAGWAAPTVSIAFDVKITPALWIASRVDSVVRLSQPTFLIDGGTIFRVFPAAIRASLGTELRF